MTVKAPAFDELIWPTIKALRAMGGSASIQELLDKVIELEAYPEEVQLIPHSQRDTKLEYNAAWARTYLKKVGALDNSVRGIWSLTKYGETITEQESKQIPKRVRKENNDQRENKNQLYLVESTEVLNTPSSEKKDWKEELLKILQSIDPNSFERLCQRILRESGFVKVEVTGKVGDGGIDGVGVLRVNLLSFQVLFQCKRYKGSVGAQDIRNFRGAMQGRSDKGLFLTTGTFTSEARKEATRDGAPTIDLLDGESLCDLIKQLKLGINVQKEIIEIETVTVNQDWFEQI